MIDGFLEELADRLAAHGVGRRTAARVVAEASDHLREASGAGTADAIRRFGAVDDFARLVAAELAIRGTRIATYWTFGVLALAGAGVTVALLLVPVAGGWPDLLGGQFGGFGAVVAIALLVLPQIAFVSGCLALKRALRLRRAPSVLDAELRLLRRRGAVAIAATVGALLALSAFALDARGELATWWTQWVAVLGLALVLLLLLAAIGLVRSAGPEATRGDEPGDVFDDFAPLFRVDAVRRLGLPEHPWRFAFLCAGAAGVAGGLLGTYAEGDPGSGLLRGGFEALALLVCFALLGGFLGLQRYTSEGDDDANAVPSRGRGGRSSSGDRARGD
jgi:hypothetical protein